MNNNFMKSAADEALRGMHSGHGGPFGAVIVRGDEIIACEHNRVLVSNDPTMHAEIAAIRVACGKLERFSLHDCEIYSTCMPCPMCLGAIMWAKIPTLYYGASAVDAAAAGFDDDYIYEYIKGGFADSSRLAFKEVDGDKCRELFDVWNKKKDRGMY